MREIRVHVFLSLNQSILKRIHSFYTTETSVGQTCVKRYRDNAKTTTIKKEKEKKKFYLAYLFLYYRFYPPVRIRLLSLYCLGLIEKVHESHHEV